VPIFSLYGYVDTACSVAEQPELLCAFRRLGADPAEVLLTDA